MNKIYKVVYCKATQTMIAVSEFAKAHGKVGGVSANKRKSCMSSSGQLKILSVSVFLALGGGQAYALGTCTFEDDPGFNGRVLCGKNTSAERPESIAIGTNANAGANPGGAGGAVAIGFDSVTGGVGEGVAVGTRTHALGDQTIALGNDAFAIGDYTVVIGTQYNTGSENTKSTGNNSVAIGSGKSEAIAQVEGDNSIAIGTKSHTKKGADGGIALGARAESLGASSIAIGKDSGQINSGHNERNVAIGEEAGNQNRAKHSVAIGTRAGTNVNTGDHAVYLGYEAGRDVVGATNVLIGKSAGNRLVGRRNVAIGKDTGKNVYGGSNVSIGPDAGVNFGEGTFTDRPNNYPEGTFTNASDNNISIGKKANNFAGGDSLKTSNNIAIGLESKAVGTAVGIEAGQSIAIGTKALAEKANTIAMGTEAQATANKSLSLGFDNKALGEQSIAIGTGNEVTGTNSGAFGDPSTVSGDASYSFGNDNTISNDNTFVVGSNVTTTQDNAVILGNDSADKAHAQVNDATVNGVSYSGFAGTATGVVSVGAAGKERQIVNVAPGEVSATSTDAINGSQLYAVASQITSGGGGEDIYFHMNTIDASQGAGDPATNLGGIGDKAGALGDHSMTAGLEAKATGVNAIAMGYQAHAGPAQVSQVESNMLAVGYDARAEGINSTAIGFKTRAIAKDTVALGNGAEATGDTGIALGKQTDAAGNFSISIGLDSRASGSGSVAIGSGAFAGEETAAPDGFIYATALGNDAKANAAKSVALGHYAQTDGFASVALGDSAVAKAGGGVALGEGSVADVEGWAHIGADPLDAGGDKENRTWKANAGAVSVGNGIEKTRQITSVAAGTRDTDAVNVAQLKAAGFKLTTSASAGGEVAGTTEEKVQNGETVTVDAGKNIKVTQDTNKITIATKDEVEFTKTTVGNVVTDAAANKITGLEAGTDDKDAVNVSQLNTQVAASKEEVKSSDGSVEVATTPNADGANVFDLSVNVDGTTITKDADGKLTANTGDIAENADGTVGAGAKPNSLTTAQDVADAINASGWNTEAGVGVDGGVVEGKTPELVKTGEKVVFDAGKNMKLVQDGQQYTYATKDEVEFTKTTVGNVITDSATNKITGLEAGTDDKDAVNFKQLKDGSQAVANALGGNTTVNPDGTISQPIFNLTDGNPADGNPKKAYNSVGDALTAIDNAVNAPITFKGDEGNTSEQKLGSTFEILAGNAAGATSSDNLKTKVENGKVTISMLDAPTFKGKVSAKGLDAGDEKITGVAAGDVSDTSTDAVNGSQLFAAAAAATTKVESADPNTVSVNTVDNPDGSKTYQVGVVTTPLTPNTDGSVADPSNPDSLATAGDIANAINNSGFTIKANSEADGELINPGDEVDLVAGDYMKIERDGGKFTFSTDNQAIANDAQLPVVYTKEDGTKVYKQPDGTFNTAADGSGTTVQPEDVIASMQGAGGSTTEPTRLANVASTLPGTAGNDLGAPDSESSVTAPALTNAQKANAATVDDVLNSGWNLQNNGDAKDFVKPYDTVNFVDGAGTEAVVTVDADNKVSDVTYNVNADEVTTQITGEKADGTKVVKVGDKYFEMDADGNPTATEVAAADVAKTAVSAKTGDLTPNDGTDPNKPAGTVTAEKPDSLATAGDIANAINNSGFLVTSSADGGVANGSSDELVNPGDKLEFVAGEHITIDQEGSKFTFKTNNQAIANDAQLPVVYTKADGTKVYKQPDGTFNEAPDGSGATVAPADIIASMQSGDGSTVTPTKLANVESTIGHNNGEGAINEGDAKTAVGDLLTQADDLSTAATVGDLQAIAQAGLDFAGDIGTDIHRPLGTKLMIVGGVTDETKLTDNNIGVVSDPATGALTVKLAKNIDLGTDGSVKTGDTTINNDGLTIAGGPSVTKAGIDAGSKKITNVAPGTDGTDAVNVDQLNTVAAAATTKVESADSNTVSVNTVDNPDGSKTYQVGVVTTPLTPNTDGSVANPANPDSLATAGDIANAINNSGFTVTSSADGGTVSGTQEDKLVTPGDKLELVAGAHMNIKQEGSKFTFETNNQAIANDAQLPVVYTKADGPKVYKQPDGTFNTTADGSGDTVAPADIIASMQGADNSTTNPSTLANVKSNIGNNDSDGAAITPAAAKANVTNLLGDTDGLNKAATTGDLQAIAQAGLDFAGDDGTVIHKPLGSQLDIVGGAKGELSDDNIGVNPSADGKLEVKLAKDLKGLNSVETIDTDGNKTLQNGGGITITPADTNKKSVSITANGLDNGGNRITHVAPGRDNTDAVNLGQLKNTAGKLYNAIGEVSKDSKAGIAGAYAAAALGQPHNPGASTIGAAIGTFRNEAALSIGISTISDNGRWILKGLIGHDTQNNTGAAASVNYQW